MKKVVIALSLAAVSAGVNAKSVTYKAIEQGYRASATGVSPIAIGTNAATNGNSSITIGSNASTTNHGSTTVGMRATTTGQLSTAIGANAQALSGTTTAIGSSALASGYSSSAIGKGTVASGTASFAGGNHATAEGGTAVAIGSHANAKGGQAAAIGANSKAAGNQSAAFGSGASSSARFATAIGYNADASHTHSVALGSLSKTADAQGTKRATVNGYTYGDFAGSNPAGSVSVGNAQLKRTVTNVAAGRVDYDSTDAINGSQLYAVAGQVGQNAQDIRSLNDRLSNFDAGLNDVRRDMHDMKRDYKAAAAHAIAHANIPQAFEPGQGLIGAGVGYYGREAAVAVGGSYATKGGRFIIKGATGFDTRKKFSAGLAVGITFGGAKQVQPVVAPVVVERVVQEVIVREVQPDTKKKIRG